MQTKKVNKQTQWKCQESLSAQVVSRCKCAADLWEWETAGERFERRWMRGVHFSEVAPPASSLHFFFLVDFISLFYLSGLKCLNKKKNPFIDNQFYLCPWYTHTHTHTNACVRASTWQHSTLQTLLKPAGANCEAPLCRGMSKLLCRVVDFGELWAAQDGLQQILT